MANRVERKKTEVSDSEMKSAIAAAWKILFGEEPTEEQIALIMAHIDLETGHRKSMWNYNVGNITTSGNHDYFDDLTTDEQIKPGVWEKRNLKYRAYSNLQEGVLNYLSLLSKSSRYAEAWNHIMHPDPEAYSKALKAGGYYTASEKKYTETLKQLFNKRIKNKEDLLNKNTELAKKIDEKLKIKNINLNETDFEELLSVLEQEPELLKLVSAHDKTRDLSNNINIKLSSDNFENTIEFARILSLALDESIQSKSFIHTDGSSVEINCAMTGPKSLCLEAAKEITDIVKHSFYKATAKIGGVKIASNIISDARSPYPPINLKKASISHRLFLLKLI